MFETSKSVMRRLHDSRFATRYFVGQGIDIGSGPDPLRQHALLFPLMSGCRDWDLQDGDAQYLATIENESLDFVHSSHCLEHLHDPVDSLLNWLRVLKPGGHLVVTIPDEDLYEQGVFPSTWNTDHKWTFTLHKVKSWSQKSINLFELLTRFSTTAQIIKIELIDATYNFDQHNRNDQTLTSIGESAIEFILRKLTTTDKELCGRLPQDLKRKDNIESIPTELETARKHYISGRFGAAETHYQRLIISKPDSAVIYKEFGNTLLARGSIPQAEQAYRHALQLDPALAEVHNNLGNVLRLSGNFAAAEQSFLKALDLLPDSAEIHNNFGVFLLDTGHLEAAEQQFRKAIILNADFAQAYFNRGKALQDLGRQNAAKKYFLKAEELHSISLMGSTGA